MAKQRNTGLGVVSAAREVSAIQGRFQDFGGQFMKGFEKSMEAKRKREAEAKEILDRSNAYMNQFKNDIDVVKFKPEDQKIVKDTIARWRNEYADAAAAAAKIQDKTGADYQEYMDTMNNILNRMSNLKNNIDNLALHKAEHYSNINDDLYSNTGTNQSSLLQAQVMVEMPIGSIDDSGDLLWGEGANQFSFQNFSKPLERASKEVAAVGAIMAKSGRMKSMITEGDRITIEGQIDDLFKGNRAIESIMSDSEFETLRFNDLDPSNPDDRKEAIQRLKNGVIGNWGKGLSIQERAVRDGRAGANGRNGGRGSGLTSAQKDYNAAVNRVKKGFKARVPFLISETIKVVPSGSGWKVKEWDPVDKIWVNSDEVDRKTVEGLIGLIPVS